MVEQTYEIIMTRHYMKEYNVIVVTKNGPNQAMKEGMKVIDDCQHKEGPLEYLGELDEFSIKNVSTKQD